MVLGPEQLLERAWGPDYREDVGYIKPVVSRLRRSGDRGRRHAVRHRHAGNPGLDHSHHHRRNRRGRHGQPPLGGALGPDPPRVLRLGCDDPRRGGHCAASLVVLRLASGPVLVVLVGLAVIASITVLARRRRQTSAILLEPS